MMSDRHPYDIPKRRQAALDALCEHLIATGEQPIDPATNRWLAEAEAVARDAASDGISPDAQTKRIQQVQMLLESADEISEPTAAAHVAAAVDCCVQLLSENDSE
ncbi:hypothetical protein [Natronocalculus amylovorans]|uniref:DUF8152 domain-containing protein n=1 Tax=Natronocalculus amylovorans TaxID=2917812 RepID=A0AAE3FV60_9EURY|nr:hypothetical protein [Natronocalculus amylovorans]MCL9816152.1 hypothetical protein [Natronocalculus amylovorans]